MLTARPFCAQPVPPHLEDFSITQETHLEFSPCPEEVSSQCLFATHASCFPVLMRIALGTAVSLIACPFVSVTAGNIFFLLINIYAIKCAINKCLLNEQMNKLIISRKTCFSQYFCFVGCHPPPFPVLGERISRKISSHLVMRVDVP